MIIKTFTQLNDDDCVRYHAYRATPNYTHVWRKVRRIDRDTIELTDRHGSKRKVTWDQCKVGGIRFKCWTPGDPREDGDNL